jgi:hypothetical protein
VGNLLDPGVEGLGLDAEVGRESMYCQIIIVRFLHPNVLPSRVMDGSNIIRTEEA